MRGKCLLCQIDAELILFESENFFIACDPYPLAVGHIMIISKEHYSCSGELPEQLIKQCSQLANFVSNEIKHLFPSFRLICYEHGRAGACLSVPDTLGLCHHMHLHLLPISVNLEESLSKIFSRKHLINFLEIGKFFHGYGEYLYYKNSDDIPVFYPAEGVNVVPHLIRTLISIELGKPEYADWETYPSNNLLQLSKTIFKNIFTSNQLIEYDLF